MAWTQQQAELTREVGASQIASQKRLLLTNGLTIEVPNCLTNTCGDIQLSLLSTLKSPNIVLSTRTRFPPHANTK